MITEEVRLRAAKKGRGREWFKYYCLLNLSKCRSGSYLAV